MYKHIGETSIFIMSYVLVTSKNHLFVLKLVMNILKWYYTPEWKMKVKSLSRVQLFATPCTVAHQDPPSMGFSRQEHWSGVPLPSPIQWNIIMQMNESQLSAATQMNCMHKTEQKKWDTKEYMQCNSIFIKVENRQHKAILFKDP